jgi:hypothetical protein
MSAFVNRDGFNIGTKVKVKGDSKVVKIERRAGSAVTLSEPVRGFKLYDIKELKKA